MFGIKSSSIYLLLLFFPSLIPGGYHGKHTSQYSKCICAFSIHTSQNHAATCGSGYLIFVIPIGSGYLKKKSGSKKTTGSRHLKIFRIKKNRWFWDLWEKIRFKEPLVPGTLETNQMKRTAGSGYFKNFKESYQVSWKNWQRLDGFRRIFEMFWEPWLCIIIQ